MEGWTTSKTRLFVFKFLTTEFLLFCFGLVAIVTIHLRDLKEDRIILFKYKTNPDHTFIKFKHVSRPVRQKYHDKH